MKRRQYLDDFIEMASLCDKIDGLDMYFVGDSATLAYALERLSEKHSYADTVVRWKVLAKEQNCNELSWSIIQAAMDSIDTDPGVSLRDEAAARRRAAIYHFRRKTHGFSYGDIRRHKYALEVRFLQKLRCILSHFVV